MFFTICVTKYEVKYLAIQDSVTLNLTALPFFKVSKELNIQEVLNIQSGRYETHKCLAVYFLAVFICN